MAETFSEFWNTILGSDTLGDAIDQVRVAMEVIWNLSRATAEQPRDEYAFQIVTLLEQKATDPNGAVKLNFSGISGLGYSSNTTITVTSITVTVHLIALRAVR